jgi:general secretion pathway protein J
MTPAHRSHGFTLLELLIGMTLVGFILTLLFAGLRLGMRSWEAGEQHMVSSSRQGIIVDFIRRTLEQTYPMYWRVDNEEQLAFAGEPDSLRIVGPVPMHEGASNNYLIALNLADGADGHDLVMRWQMPDPRAPGFGTLEEAKPKVLVKAVKELAFAYFGAESDADEPTWHDQWLRQKVPPELIRLKLMLENGDTWPDIVVATPIRTE